MVSNNMYKMNTYLLYPPQQRENYHYPKGYAEINTRPSFVNKIIIIFYDDDDLLVFASGKQTILTSGLKGDTVSVSPTCVLCNTLNSLEHNNF